MVIDASIWIAGLLRGDAHHEIADRWLEETRSRATAFAIPMHCLAEVAGAVARQLNAVEGERLAEAVAGLPHLQLVEIDQALGREGMRLAASLRLRGADALYVAVAARLAMPLVTFDGELASRAAPAVEVITPA